MSKLSKVLKLLNSMSSEEMSNVKDYLADEEVKDNDQKVDTPSPNEVEDTKEKGKEKSLEVEPKEEPKQEVKEDTKENTQELERKEEVGEDDSQNAVDQSRDTGGQVIDEKYDPTADGRPITDFVLKQDVDLKFKELEARLNSLQDENTKLRERAEKAESQAEKLHGKYEQPFGTLEAKQHENKSPNNQETFSSYWQSTH